MRIPKCDIFKCQYIFCLKMLSKILFGKQRNSKNTDNYH